MPARITRTMKSKTTAAIVAPNRGLELGVIVAKRVTIADNAICVAVESTASPKAAFWAVPSLREKAIATCNVRGNASITKCDSSLVQKSNRSVQDPGRRRRIHGIDNFSTAASFPRVKSRMAAKDPTMYP
jgi:hypothetical protein